MSYSGFPLILSSAQIISIAQALSNGSPEIALSGSEITRILRDAGISDVARESTKWKRLCENFESDQKQRNSANGIFGFLQEALNPERYLGVGMDHKFEAMRERVNKSLAFSGIAVNPEGRFKPTSKVSTINAAARRAMELREGLEVRGLHPEVFKYCRQELLVDDYFHAVLEAVKSISERVRSTSGLTGDGADLFNQAFAGAQPKLAINSLRLESEKSEQKGFANLLIGVTGMFRNPTAHAPRLTWPMSKSDAQDILSIVSLIHRRLDTAIPTGY